MFTNDSSSVDLENLYSQHHILDESGLDLVSELLGELQSTSHITSASCITDIVSSLNHAVEQANRLTTCLSNCKGSGNHIDLIGQIDLQLTAVAVSIMKLNHRLLITPCTKPQKSILDRVKQLLLKDFDFINRPIRGKS